MTRLPSGVIATAVLMAFERALLPARKQAGASDSYP